MLPELYEYKSTTLGTSFATKGGSINLDEAQGMVECFVAGIGNKDSVGDIVTTGAFTKSLQRRKPRVVWGHNWNDPIGKVLEIYEVPNTDPRLPLKMKMAGIGGLFARVQFNLNSEKGKEAFAMVAFFGEEQEWSIGYKTLRAQFDQKSQANVIYELELYEVSPVLHGANQLTGTISVKSEEGGYSGPVSYMEEDEEETLNRAEIEKQLGLMLGTKVSLMDVNGEELTFARRADNGEVARYKCHFTGGRGRYMFGAPEPITVVAPRRPSVPMPGMPTMPVGSPGIVMNQPQRPTRPPAMSMPVAIRPGQNGPQIIALPAVEYEDNDTQDFDPNNLDKEEADLRDALLKITKRHGKFNQDSEGVWAGYTPAAENSIAGIGVKCANCVFYQGGDSCKIIDMEVESEGKCRFAVIPNGVVKGDSTAKKTYEIEDEFGQEDYVADLEVKYPGELAVAALRGAVGRRRQKRRKFKLLSEFGSQNDWPEEKAYLLPVVPKFAFMVKQALDPIFDYHGVESFVDVDGIVMSSGISYDLIEAVDTAVDNLKKKSINENDIEWKAASYRLGRAIGGRLTNKPNIGGGRSAGRFFTSIGAEDFDPFTARDANLNGIVGEGLFLRGVLLATPDPTPDGPGSIRNPKPSRAQVRKPESEIIDRAGDGKVKPVGSKLSSGKLFDVPNIEDPDVDSATKYGSAESQRDELQGVLDGASDKDQIKRLKQAISELDKYMARVEKMAEGEMEKEKTPKKPKAARRAVPDRDLVTSIMQQDQERETLSSDKNMTSVERFSSGKLPDKAQLPEGSSQLKEFYEAMSKDVVKLLTDLMNDPNSDKNWKLPWRRPELYARNPTRGRVYQGMNQLTLSLIGMSRGYELPRWAGEGQWKKFGGKLKPGGRSKGVSILVPREGRTFTDINGKEVVEGRYYEAQTVYNVAEVAGLPQKYYDPIETEINQEARLEDLENVIKEIGPDFVESFGEDAFYRPSTDKIHMPAFEQFVDAAAFYGTAMHETIHWTSHPTRLNRTLGKEFGDEQYAFEELIAEIGSAFAMGAMGLEPTIRDNHLVYVAGWLKKLTADPLALHRAILSAQQANDFLLDRSSTMRRLAGIPDDERKGKDNTWLEVPMLAGYEDSPRIKPTPGVSGTMEDMLDVEFPDDFAPEARRTSAAEREMSSLSRNLPTKTKDGIVITPSGRLSSGRGPIKGKNPKAPEVKPIDETVALRLAFGLSNEPTEEQRDIMAVAMHLIRNKDPRILSILAGAGTGKTTTLKSIAWGLQREFDLWPEGDLRRPEQLRYLSSTYGVDFSNMSAEQVGDAVAKLAEDKSINNLYYAVFNKKNQFEAELEFPRNTGVSTTDKIWYWSLKLGQGDKKYGTGMRRKMQFALISPTDRKVNNPGAKNPKFISEALTPDEPERLLPQQERELFDGTTESFDGFEPGYRTLGWTRLDTGSDWKEFLNFADEKRWKGQETRPTAVPVLDDKGKPVRDAGGKIQTTMEDLPGFILPDADSTFVSRDQFGDIFKNALLRWSLSKEEKAAAWMFTPPPMFTQSLDTPRGHGGDISAVDTILDEKQIPAQWVEALQEAIDKFSDGDSNMLPPRDSVAKLWMLTEPDLRTDPGLITHTESQERKRTVPDSYSVGDEYEFEGETWIVKTRKKSKGKNVQVTLTKRMATEEKPLSAFFVDEAQDSNEILETVLDNNRANLPIVVVGDDRQAVYAFRNAKNILESLNADYELTITESFRYGEVIGHLTNLALGMQNLYLDKQGVPQLPWKHVKGKAQVVVNRLFDPLLPKKDRKGLEPVDEIDDMTREFLIKDLEEKFSTPEKRLNFSVHTVGKKAGEKLTRKEQDEKLRELRDSVLEPKAGKIVDRVEEANKEVPNLPTMILCRTNAEIINETLKFIKLVVDSPNAKKDDNGLPIMPEVVIPLSKHEELLKFTKHLEYIFMPQAEKSKRGLPEVSSWIGPVFDQKRLKEVINQKAGQQARSAYKLIMQAPPGGGSALGISGMLTLLQGRQKIEIDSKTGKEKITVIPASILPERKSVTLENFRIEPEEIDAISKFSKAASAPQAKESQLQRIVIIPPPSTSTDGRQAVYAQLEIIGGDEKKSGKPSGRIIVTGDGVDTGRPQTLPDGSEARNIPPNQRVGNGRYRRDLEKVILNLGLSEKVKIMQDAERGGPRAGGKRRAFDGFVIEGENLEESTKILNDIGQALRDAAEGPGGDVEITTIQLSKGRESDFVAVAEDLGDPRDSLAANIPQGQAGLAFMEETNLIHVAFSRAKKMIDPGWKGFKYYLHDESTKDVRAAIKKAVADGHIPPELDKGAFGDEGGIPLPKFYSALNKMSPDDIDENNLPDRAALADEDIEIDPDLVIDVDKDINDVVYDPDDYESEVDIDDLIDADEMGDDGDSQMRLSSGTSNYPGPGRRLSRRMGVRSSSRVNPGAISAQDLAGIRLFGDPNSARNRRLTDFAMQTWAGFRERGIEINAESKDKTKNAMMEVGKAMKARQNRVRVGRVGDNLVNDSPSAETWMLSVDVLAEQLRIPEEVAINGRVIRARSATRQEIASLLGLSGQDKQRIENPDAGINHDAVRLLVAELGNRPELAAWRYFAPVSRDEIRKIIPSPTGDTESITPEVDMAMENAGRANMRDRFIIETFGKDAFPHWFDQDEGEAITPDEYSKLGEVDERAKFRATGRFAPDDPFEGDSEAEIDLYGQSFDELVNPPSLADDGEVLKLDKTDKKDFEIEPLLEYLGIDKSEWKTKLRGVLAEKFETENIGDIVKWSKDGIPTANIAHMIRKGVIPSASDVWKEGKVGQLFDAEMERPKYAVYEALNEFIDRSFPTGRLNTDAIRSRIVGATDMRSAIRDAVAARGSAWNPKKGTEPRFAVSEMQTMVDRFNEIFGTNHTLEDIFSAEQLRNAKERIESGETLWKPKRTPKTGN